MKFSQIIGHQALKDKLRGNVIAGRIPHAQLFLGKSGYGGLPLALAYAQFISCKDRLKDDSCGTCSSCKKYETLTHPDLHFSFPFSSDKGKIASENMETWRKSFLANPYIDYNSWMKDLGAEKKQGNIPVAECREIIKSLSLMAFESEYKVLILWLPEFLGDIGNTLLKIIEEPPVNTLFLLVAESSEKVLGTILSRTQILRIPPIDGMELKEYLKTQHQMDDDQSTRIALMSDGDFNNAIDLMQGFESPYFELWRNWMAMCYRLKPAEANAWVDELSGMGKEGIKAFLSYGLALTRSIMVVAHVPELNTWSGREAEFVESFRKLNFSLDQIEKLVHVLEQCIFGVERNAQLKALFIDATFSITRIMLDKKN